MTTSAHADFVAADLAWFSSNLHRSFRYHVLPPTLAIQLIEGMASAQLMLADEPATAIVLAYRKANAAGSVGYSIVLVPTAVAEYGQKSCPGDELGRFWVDDNWPLFPRLTRQSVAPAPAKHPLAAA